MSAWRTLYNLLLRALMPFALMRLWWRGRRQPGYRQHLPERFGFYSVRCDKPIVWVHSVSVGETRAAEPLVAALRQRWPDHTILLTHMTPTGRQTGEQVFGTSVLRCYLPYDLPGAVTRFLTHFRPRLGVLMETEIWPNLIHGARMRSIPLYLVNARLSARSARGYARLRSITAQTLRELTGIAAQSNGDAERLRALGAQRVVVVGNLKFDRSPRERDLELGAQFRAGFGPRQIFLAASTREGEEEQVLDALRELDPAVLAIIVPRHPQRFDSIAALLEQKGISYERRSSERAPIAQTRVWLGDSMGEMYAYYAACDVAFVGGSLVPLGGQNLLEACALGKPVLVGLHTYNFTEATEVALAAGAALRVGSAEELGRAAAALLKDPARRAQMGRAGIELMREHQGAAERIAALLQKRVASEVSGGTARSA